MCVIVQKYKQNRYILLVPKQNKNSEKQSKQSQIPKNLQSMDCPFNDDNDVVVDLINLI